MARTRWLVSISIMAIALATPANALAASGDLDASFHGDGKTHLDVFAPGGFASASALALYNGKVVVAGDGSPPSSNNMDVIVGRFGPNGFADASCMNGAGFRVLDFGGREALDNGLAVLPNGNILIAGYSRPQGGTKYSVFVARLLGNCKFDTSFANGQGALKSDLGYGSGAVAYDLEPLPNGKFLVAGSVYPNEDEGDVALWRFNASGTLDMAFGGGDGIATLDVAPGFDEAWRVLVMDDGKLLVGGWVAVDPTSGYDIMLARFTADGLVDPTFGIEGSISYNPTSDNNEYVNGMAFVNNKILICIPGTGPNDDDIVLMRLGRNGFRDRSFGSFGEVALDFGGDEECRGFAVQADNKLVVVGSQTPGNEWFVARILSNGQKDMGFGTNGFTNADDEFGNLYAVAFDTAARIVVAGSDSDQKMAAGRLLP